MKLILQQNLVLKLSTIFFICIAFANNSKAQYYTHDEHEHFNHAAVFIGSTAQYEVGRQLLSIGVDYTHFNKRLKKVGIGVFTEAIFADYTQWVFGVPFFYKITEEFIVRTGPGMELVKKSGNNLSGNFVWRLGAAYEFRFKDLTITPSFDIDFIRYHHAMVWGVNIGKGF